MTSEAAARRLEVKPATLYAYVSRGLIRSEREPGTRRSRFLRADVERLAVRGRGGRSAGLEVIVESQLTLLDPAGHLYYRGWDVRDAVETSTFEAVATWLWTGVADPDPFVAPRATVSVARAHAERLTGMTPDDVWRSVLIVIRNADPLRADRRAIAVQATGKALIGALVDCLPVLGAAPDPEAPVAHRLWPRLTAAPPSRTRVAILDAILLLMADHEMAASTLAARVAASAWADPYLVVEAGLAVLGGPLHGAASEEVRHLLRDAGPEGRAAAEAVGARLSRGERVPGLGHRVYETVDPRAELLLDRLRAAGDLPGAVPALLDLFAERHLPFPNVDFALAAVGEAYGFIAGALQTVVAGARIAGWLAHAIEEYEHALRFRTRAAYIGPRPDRVTRSSRGKGG